MARRTREIWKNLIEQYERSGLGQEEYAAKRGIPVGTLRSWIYRLKRERLEQEAAILPVRVIASTAPTARAPGAASAAIEVVLPDGVRVRFASSTASEVIAEVVTRLRRC
jgi:hypothetical protein